MERRDIEISSELRGRSLLAGTTPPGVSQSKVVDPPTAKRTLMVVRLSRGPYLARMPRNSRDHLACLEEIFQEHLRRADEIADLRFAKHHLALWAS